MLVYTIVANTMLTSCCRGTAVVIAISAARLVHDSSGLAELQHDFGSQAAWRRTALVCILQGFKVNLQALSMTPSFLEIRK